MVMDTILKMVKVLNKQLTNTVGAKLRILRRRNGQTRKELAGNAGISVSYLSLVERDKRQISFSTFIRLCKGLEVSPVMVAMMLDFNVQEEAEALNIAMRKYGALI